MFQELGTISDVGDGWQVPTKILGDGCLCIDGTFSKGIPNADIVFPTLEDAFHAARDYCLKHGEVYPWWLVGNAATGWLCSSNDGITELKEDRSMSTTVGTASKTVMVPVESQVMEF